MLKNIIKIFTSHLIVKAIGILNIVIVLLFFSVENFGNYSFIILVLNLFAITVDPILSSYLVDYKFFNYDRYNFGILIITLFLGVLSYLLLDAFILNIPIVLFTLFSITYAISASLKSYLNIKDRYYDYGIVDVVRQCCILITTIIYFYGFNYNEALELLEFNYLISSIAMILLAILFLKKAEIEFSLQIQKLKTLLLNSKFLIFYTAIIPLITFIDSYFVESFLTEEDLGMYSFSVKIYSISLMLVVPIFTILNIKQIEIAKEHNYLNFIRGNFKKIASLSLVMLVLSILFN
ncbi:oligosaccharide flippase family protein, partial [Polaribacter sp.]|nr:oligosaccharide flippase family protein [Polaribacter sp.]